MQADDTVTVGAGFQRRLRFWLIVLAVLWWSGLAVFGWLLSGSAWAGDLRSTPAMPERANQYRAELTRAAHSAWGLDAPVAVLAAQVHQESGWRPEAVSRTGAAGLGQFMPATARWWCQINRISPDDCQPSNPTWALRALAGYDRALWLQMPKLLPASALVQPGDRWWMTLRAYNGGAGHLQREARRTGADPDRAALDAACGRAGRAPSSCAENLAYPRRILIELQPLYLTWGAGVAVTR